MLSRDHVIHRSRGEDHGEELRHARSGARARAKNAGSPRTGRWWRLALLTLVILMLGSFLLLNRGAVVEPRLDLIVFSVAQPGLLAVLLLTSFASAAAALLVRSALHATTHRPDMRRPPADLRASPTLTDQPITATAALGT